VSHIKTYLSASKLYAALVTQFHTITDLMVAFAFTALAVLR
jgi:hypothetical protein